MKVEHVRRVISLLVYVGSSGSLLSSYHHVKFEFDTGVHLSFLNTFSVSLLRLLSPKTQLVVRVLVKTLFLLIRRRRRSVNWIYGDGYETPRDCESGDGNGIGSRWIEASVLLECYKVFIPFSTSQRRNSGSSSGGTQHQSLRLRYNTTPLSLLSLFFISGFLRVYRCSLRLVKKWASLQLRFVF